MLAMEATSSRSLEVTVLSAENLRLDGKPIKRNAFVVLKTDPHNCKSTNADYEGGSYPSWNQKLELTLPPRARSITLEVQCKTSSGYNRVIGTAIVPFSDFSGGFTPEGYLHFLSYRLRGPREEKNGIVNISVRVMGPVDYYASRKNATQADYWSNNSCGAGYGCSSSFSSSSTRPLQQSLGMPVVGDQKNSYYGGGGGVVTGVPLWGASRA